MKVGQEITQNDINLKLFQSLEKLDEKRERFEQKISDRMDKFDAKISTQMNWHLTIFTIIMVGVLAKVIVA